METKLCIITGATDGIGKETARNLLTNQMHLVLIGRDSVKGEEVREELKKTELSSKVDFIQCDLSVMSHVGELAKIIKKRYDTIDVFINNAGAYFSQRILTSEGLESTFALNYLTYFHLTNLLLPKLKKQKSCRIINVASDAHYGAKIDFKNLQGERLYDGWKAYKISKLMNIMFTYELAEKLSKTKVTVNCLHPGFVATKFGNNNPGLTGIGMRIAKKLAAISVKKGAQTSVYLATSSEVEGVSGKYFHKYKTKESSEASNNVQNWDLLWKQSAKILKSITN